MTFGLCNAPVMFQTIMQNIFNDLIDEGHVIVYLNNILIFHDSPTQLTNLTHEVLRRFLKWDLYLKPEKYSFAKDTIKYLGFVISHGHLQMDPEKVSGILKWPQPHNVKKVQSFLGFCNFYHQFIKDYSAITWPLFDLTRKDTPFTWDTPQQTAYNTLLQAFTTAPILTFPDPEKPYRLITDASNFTIRAILEQPHALNRWHPITYYSKSLQPAERNYEIRNKELLAIILALEHFCHYLEGHAKPIEVWTDHGNLVYFMKKQKLSRRQARWALYLSRFNFTIVHKPGSQNKADALSWHPNHTEGMELDNEQWILLDTKFFTVRATRPTAVTIQGDPTLCECIRAAQDYDTEVSKALESILKNGPRTVSRGLEDWNLKDGIILHKGQIYIPKDTNLRWDIVKAHHEHVAMGHPGRWKTYELVSREFWWPGMSIFIRDFADGCATCQATKVRPCTQVSSIHKKSHWLSLLLQHPESCQYNIFYDFLFPKAVSPGTVAYSLCEAYCIITLHSVYRGLGCLGTFRFSHFRHPNLDVSVCSGSATLVIQIWTSRYVFVCQLERSHILISNWFLCSR